MWEHIGEKGVGGIGEVGDERVGREIPLRVAERWRNRKKIMQHCKIFCD